MAYDIEQRLLGSLIQCGDPGNLKVQKAMLELDGQCFRDYDCKMIFELVKKLFKLNQPFDVFTIMESIPDDQYPLFTEISAVHASLNTVAHDLELVVSRKQHRNILRELEALQSKVQNESIYSEAVQLAIEGCLALSQQHAKSDKNLTTSEELAEQLLSGEELDDKTIPTGLTTLDLVNKGGFKNKSLITIAGRPSMGKTNFSVYLAHNLALNHEHQHVLFFSLEMTAAQIYQKQLACVMKKHVEEMTQTEKERAIHQAKEVLFSIDTTPLATIDYIQMASRIMKTQRPMSIIVVDYLGLVNNTNMFESHTLRLADVTAKLSALAIELDCIVILLTQVNRNYATRDSKEPFTSDAADSIGSERNSAYWLGIYRPEIDKPDDLTVTNQFLVICRKNRWVEKLWTVGFDFNKGTFKEAGQNRFEPSQPVKGWSARKQYSDYKGEM